MPYDFLNPTQPYSYKWRFSPLQNLTVTGIASAEAFGSDDVAGPIKDITGIASAEAFGTASVSSLDHILPSGIASAEAFGTAKLTLYILPSGIASAEAFGTDDVVGPIKVTGIASAEAFGNADVVGTIKNTGIASAEAFGTPKVAGPVIVPGILTGTAFGILDIVGPITVTGIASAEAFGTAIIVPKQSITVTGIASAEVVSTGARVSNSKQITVTGIASAEAFGTARLTGGRQTVNQAGGIYQGAVGTPSILGGVQDLEVFIGNYNRTKNYREESLKVTFTTIGKSTATFDLFDNTGTFAPSLGMTVLCKEYNRKLFMGCIFTIKAVREMSTDNQITYSCTAQDKSSILDHRVVNKTYEADEDAADVIRDIVLNFLNGEGINTNGVPQSLGPLGSQQVFNLVTVTNAFDAIYNLVAAQWWLDMEGTLFFVPLADAPAAPFSINETSKNWRNLSVQSTLVDYRNKEYVKTNLNVLPGTSTSPTPSLAPARSESYTVPSAVQIQQQFVIGAGLLQYGIVQIIQLKVNHVVKQAYSMLGAYGTGPVANDLTTVWNFLPGSPYLNPPVSGPDVPNNGDLIEVSYIPYNYTSSVQAASPLTPTPPSGILTPPGTSYGTCGSGVYEFVDQVTDIQYQGDLDAIAAGILARSGGVPFIVSFETDVPGLMPGMKLEAYIPRMFLENSGSPIDLYVTQVSGGSLAANLGKNIQNPGPDASFRWQVSASDRRDIGDYIKWYQRLVTRSNLALPITQYEEATFVLSPGGSVASGLNQTNPYIVGRSGKLVECLVSTSDPPVDEDLVIDILVNGFSIFDTLKVVLPALQTSLLTATNFASVPLYLTKNNILTINTSYLVKGPNPAPGGSVTVKLRWAI